MTDKIVIAMEFVDFLNGKRIAELLADGWQPLGDNFTNQIEILNCKPQDINNDGGHPYITFVKYASPVLVDSRVITGESEETLRDKILPLIKDGWIPLNEVRFDVEAGFYQTWVKYEYPDSTGAPAHVAKPTPKPTPPIPPLCSDCGKKLDECECDEIPF